MVDTSIPLGATFQQPDIGRAAQSANAIFALQQNQQKAQSQNALRSLLAQPGAVDATGSPTPNALRQIMAIDPATGMQFQSNAAELQTHKARLEDAKLKRFMNIQSMIDQPRDAALSAYDEVIKNGGSV